MKRLTFVDEKGNVLFTPKGCDEDVGYTIIQLVEGGHIDLLNEIANRLANHEQRLKYYEDLEEQGLLMKPKCLPGDIVWEANKARNIISEYEVASIRYGINKTFHYMWALRSGIYSNLEGFRDKDIGKTVFLTQAEAKEALRRMESEENNGTLK